MVVVIGVEVKGIDVVVIVILFVIVVLVVSGDCGSY